MKAAFLCFTLDEWLSRSNKESGFHDFSSSDKTALPQNGGFRGRKVSVMTDQSTWFMASLIELVASPIELMASLVELMVFSIELIASSIELIVSLVEVMASLVELMVSLIELMVSSM
ncbi:MAG: hypothetical protein LH702_35875 [Phormidesmis sp. CAN_BIN44]|nr:hypothetical protein [Phormidesmis sp. CAN_BIN44]